MLLVLLFVQLLSLVQHFATLWTAAASGFLSLSLED